MRLTSYARSLPLVALMALAGTMSALAQDEPAVSIGPAVGKPIPPLTTVDAEFDGTFRKFASHE